LSLHAPYLPPPQSFTVRADMRIAMASSKLRRILLVGALLVLCASCGSLGVFVLQAFDPPDRVRVFVSSIPKGIDFLSLATSTDGEAISLDWSPAGELRLPLTIHPADASWSYRNPWPPSIEWHAYVHWRRGQRYGVVTRTVDGQWQVAWFDADEVPLLGKRWLLGGGRAKFDLAGRKAEPLGAWDLYCLGLQTVDDGD
jgi:hypothetical protein